MLRTVLAAGAMALLVGCASPTPPPPGLALLPGAEAAAFQSDRIAVQVVGAGPDVVLIPGLGSTPRAWASTVAAVPGHRYHLVQLRGFGGLAPGGAAADGPVA